MLPEQIADSIKNIGAEKTIAIMARSLCYIAQSSKIDLEFNCDLGVVSVERKTIKTND